MIEIPRYVTTHEHAFDGIRYSDNKLYPVQWKLTVDVAEIALDDMSREDHHRKSAVAYQKMIFWVETVLCECVVGGVKNISDLNAFRNTKIMIPCNEPSDVVFLETLHCKLSCVLGDVMVIENIKLYSSDMNMTTHYNHDYDNYDLPTQEDFMGAGALYDEPWWCRSDCDTIDIYRDSESKQCVLDNAAVLSEFEKHIEEALFGERSEKDDQEKPSPAGMNEWPKPRIV